MQADDVQVSEAGFTLLEVIVSFVILAMVLGSATLSLSYSVRLGREADEKRLVAACAERILAEKFDRRPGMPATEAGADNGCPWRIVRKPSKAAYTESGRSLIEFRLEILTDGGRPLEEFETFYLEASPL